jgi:pimeloyl-ACP methyl ester carboxylesterase
MPTRHPDHPPRPVPGDPTARAREQRTRRLLASAIAFVALIGAAALALEGAALRRDAAAHPAPGQLIEVDGAAMHLDCRGSGSPTVLLEAGMGGDSSSWAWVHDELAAHTRVCAYDRPGYGWSAATAAQRDPASVASVAARLLDRAGEQGPYVVVGHSLGAHHVRAFAALSPEAVAAVALVDGRHHDVAHVVDGFERDVAMSRWALRLGTWLAPFGVVRALGPSDAHLVAVDAADHVSLVTDRRHAESVARSLVDLVERVRSGS